MAGDVHTLVVDILGECRTFWGECEQANEENEVAECQQSGKLNSCS